MAAEWLPFPVEQAEAERLMAMRMGYRDIRYHASDQERALLEKRAEYTWHHARPWSILICPMGYHWKPGSWQRVVDMVHFTQQRGIYVVLQEIMDRCFHPYDALGAMRNEAVMKARQGFEFLCYVDCDILPPHDALLRLLSRDVAIAAPYIVEPGTNKPLHGPHRKPHTGLQWVRWCVLSMLLFRTSVFNAIPWEAWNNAIGADEGYHFQKFWDVGHRPYIDTDLIVPVTSIPTYPLQTNRFTENDAKSFWDKRRDWLNEPPDRAPIDPSDPRQINGEYLPWHASNDVGMKALVAPMTRGGTG